MSTGSAIRIQGLGKRYQLGPREPYKSLRESIAKLAVAPFRRKAAPDPGGPDTFWALRDVSFEIGNGEVAGIIGRNGAGKSTLLKILSRITQPTEGRATLEGRVGSLLEVGVGFHPELSGRDNIFLNGAILGMRRAETRRKFDEIVAFAEIEAFLETPVKRYSSGMYVRLAFAVAAHLEPEVLFVDEVLAVGDAAFQRKCLGKMGSVAREGRTVLFVSHNMAAVLALCPRAILLEGGRVVADGPAKGVVDRYLDSVASVGAAPIADRKDRKGSQRLRFESFGLRDKTGNPLPCGTTGSDVVLTFRYSSKEGRPLRNTKVAIGVHGRFDETLFHLATSTCDADFDELPPTGEISCHLPRLSLQPGRYSFNLFCTVGDEIADWIQNAGVIDVESGDFFGTGKLPPVEQGQVVVEHRWSFTSLADATIAQRSSG